jgi:hypothetical protein
VNALWASFANRKVRLIRAYIVVLVRLILYTDALFWSRGSSVIIVYGYGGRGSIPGRGERIFLLASVSRPALGPTQAPVQCVPLVLSPGGKARPWLDADQSSASSAEVMNK